MLVPHPFADDLSTDKSNANFPFGLKTPVDRRLYACGFATLGSGRNTP